MTPLTFKKNEENDVVKKEYKNKMSDMTQKIEGIKAMATFVIKQQTPNSDEKDLNNMVTHILDQESSAMGPHYSASTHYPFNEKVYVIENCLVDFEIL